MNILKALMDSKRVRKYDKYCGVFEHYDIIAKVTLTNQLTAFRTDYAFD